MLVQYLGLLLQAGAMLAIGTFISTLTKNQIIAAATTFAVVSDDAAFWMADGVRDCRLGQMSFRTFRFLRISNHSNGV